jgi:hypothetical protein
MDRAGTASKPLERTLFDRVAIARRVSLKKCRSKLPGRQGRRGLSSIDAPEKHCIAPVLQLGSSPAQRQVTFQFADPQAVSVLLAATFKNWDAHSHPLQKVGSGEWCLKMVLEPGR